MQILRAPGTYLGQAAPAAPTAPIVAAAPAAVVGDGNVWMPIIVGAAILGGIALLISASSK